MNSSFPRLSLVIPCYNEERTLRDCVTRCLALRERNIDLELVIVDDCSTDKSLAVAHELESEFPGIAVVHHSVNKNLSINNFPISLPESDEGSSKMRESQVS